MAYSSLESIAILGSDKGEISVIPMKLIIEEAKLPDTKDATLNSKFYAFKMQSNMQLSQSDSMMDTIDAKLQEYSLEDIPQMSLQKIEGKVNWLAHSEGVHHIKKQEFGDKTVIISISSSHLVIKIWDLEGKNLGAINLEAPLPTKWSLITNAEKKKDVIFLALKYAEIISKSTKTKYPYIASTLFKTEVPLGSNENGSSPTMESVMAELKSSSINKISLRELDKRKIHFEKMKTVNKMNELEEALSREKQTKYMFAQFNQMESITDAMEEIVKPTIPNVPKENISKMDKKCKEILEPKKYKDVKPMVFAVNNDISKYHPKLIRQRIKTVFAEEDKGETEVVVTKDDSRHEKVKRAYDIMSNMTKKNSPNLIKQ